MCDVIVAPNRLRVQLTVKMLHASQCTWDDWNVTLRLNLSLRVRGTATPAF